MKPRWWVVALCAAALAGAAPEPSEYRMQDYRAPTPETLHGATVLTTDAAHELWVSHRAAFIDVLPRPPRPAGLPPATIWQPKPRADIPGSMWLPDTGYGTLAPVMEQYFARGLAQATGGEHGSMLVFYCLRDCWMSWNAAKRAVALGYSNVAWYPDGTDGWDAQGFPLAPAEPVAQPATTE